MERCIDGKLTWWKDDFVFSNRSLFYEVWIEERMNEWMNESINQSECDESCWWI